MRAARWVRRCVMALVAPAWLGAQQPTATTSTVTGTVTNAATGQPVRIATVRLAGGSTSSLTNDAGRYRLELPLGTQRIEVRRIGYRPAVAMVVVAAGGATADVRLEPLAVSLERVLVTAQDDAARRIIAAAIRRKRETRGQVHDYHYDGDVRLVVRDLRKPADSAASIVLVTQTRTSAYWEQPNRYQETIVARRQTGNLAAEQNLVGVGQIVNFSRDRVQLGRFELASPVADDALERYDFHLLDTLAVNGRRVFRLSLEPKPDGTPAFAGVIDVADSTFDVTAIDVGVNDAVRLGLARNVRYEQRFAEANGRWMPSGIALSLEVSLPIAGIQYRVEQTAALSGFRFNEGQRPAGFGEYRIVVADSADRADSSAWTRAGATSLTPLEQAAFHRIDSLEHAPRSLARRLRGGALTVLALASDRDVFHFNRADGAFVGAYYDRTLPSLPTLEPDLALGRAIDAERWAYRAGGRVRLSEARRLWVGASLYDETASRPTLTSPGYNPTLRALFSTRDPLDYYRDRGVTGTLSMKLVDFVTLDARYRDAAQSSLGVVVDRPLLRSEVEHPMRPNPAIDDGHLRALGGAVTYDSRPLVRQAGHDLRLGAPRWTRVSAGVEVAPGRALASDFAYRRYDVRVERRQQSFGWGVTSMLLTGGLAGGALPPQRFFGVDGGAQVLETQASPFSTLLDSSLSAPRAAVVAVQHEFDRLLFTRSHLPVVRDLPFTFTVRASAFWAGERGTMSGLLGGQGPYEEAGFSVGNLTPFAAPFNLSARFAWQLSRYPTTPFRFSVGFGT